MDRRRSDRLRPAFARRNPFVDAVFHMIKSATLAIEEAVAALRSGGVIACPTEAVYGLGCDPLNESAVNYLFELKQRPVIGQPLEVDVAVMPQIDAGAGDIQVTGGDGLTVAPGAKQVDLPAVEAGQVYRQTVTVTATTDGVLLLGLTVSLKHDEMIDSRAFSVPLIVDRGN